MSKRLENKVALITGGTSGIGEATVDLFVKHGAKVMVAGRSVERGEEIAARNGENASFIQTDVTKEADIKRAVDETVSKFGRIDILFNNAGGRTGGDVEDITEEDFKAGCDLLLGSVLFGMKHAVPHMKKQMWGRIINNASVAGHRTDMGMYLYSGLKAAVAHMTRVAGIKLSRDGITVNAVSPGATATPIFLGGSDVADQIGKDVADQKMEKLRRNLTNATPLGRSGEPLDLANAVLFLASEEGSFVNCHDLVVDGGMIAGGRVNWAPEFQGKTPVK